MSEFNLVYASTGRTHLLALLLLVFSLVLPNFVWAKVAVVKVSGVVVRGMKAGTGDGEPLKELLRVGEGADEGDDKWLMALGRGWAPFCWAGGICCGSCAPTGLLWGLAANGVMLLGDRLRLFMLELTDSMGRKHCASGLKVLVTSRSAEFSSWGSALSLKRTCK